MATPAARSEQAKLKQEPPTETHSARLIRNAREAGSAKGADLGKMTDAEIRKALAG